MPTKRFLIHYPDGSKEQVSAAEKEQMLLAGDLRVIDSNRFQFITKPLVFGSFAELAKLTLRPSEVRRRFLPGQFTVELRGKRYRERLETPEGMACRLANEAA